MTKNKTFSYRMQTTDFEHTGSIRAPTQDIAIYRLMTKFSDLGIETIWINGECVVVLAVIVIGITAVLLWKRNPVAMAAWLVYLYMP